MQSRNPIFAKRGGYAQQTAWGSAAPSAQQLHEMYNAPSYPGAYAPAAARPMTLDDVVVRGFITLGTLIVSAAFAWALDFPPVVAGVAAVVGLILGLIVSFRQSTNPALILGYSVAYGIAVGVVSHAYNDVFHGIVLQAVLGTAMAFGGTLAVYALRIFRPTPGFAKFVMAAMFGALGLMLVNWIAGFFLAGGLGLRTDSPMGWIFSVAMILLGCFFLLLDFADIERGVRQGVPEKYSWLMAFGLTVTLVWLYLEILRFISYFTSSD